MNVRKIKEILQAWDRYAFYEIYLDDIIKEIFSAHQQDIDLRDEIINLLEEIIKVQARYGTVGEVMELRQKINILKSKINEL